MTKAAASKTVAASNEFVTAEEIAKFQYLAGKEVSDLHETLAAYILEVSGIEISPKQVQSVLSIHGTYQKSEANRNRAGYKARTAESIRNGGVTTAERFQAIVAQQQKDAAELAKAEAEAAAKPKRTRTRKAAAPKATAEATTTTEAAEGTAAEAQA